MLPELVRIILIIATTYFIAYSMGFDKGYEKAIDDMKKMPRK